MGNAPAFSTDFISCCSAVLVLPECRALEGFKARYWEENNKA
jgi:hypothetical protein